MVLRELQYLSHLSILGVGHEFNAVQRRWTLLLNCQKQLHASTHYFAAANHNQNLYLRPDLLNTRKELVDYRKQVVAELVRSYCCDIQGYLFNNIEMAAWKLSQ